MGSEAERTIEELPYNPKHLELIRRCAEGNRDALDQWRASHPDEQLQLCQADLEGLDLPGMDLRGANLRNARLKRTKLPGADLSDANLAGADLSEANLEGTRFVGANLERTDMWKANLEGAYFWKANLRGANFRQANLQNGVLKQVDLTDAALHQADLRGTVLRQTHFVNTVARAAIVDGATLLLRCTIDGETDFTSVGLGNARIDPPEHRSLLEYNLRRLWWRKWYASWRFPVALKFWDAEQSLSRNLLLLMLLPLTALAHLSCMLPTVPVRAFWWTSKYGHSTWRLLGTFFGSTLFFAVVYLYFPYGWNSLVGEQTGFWHCPTMIQGLEVEGAPTWEHWRMWCRALYFSIVTMTTLGFGDMHAHIDSIVGQAFVVLHVMLGYYLLAALVTRLARTFQEVG